MVDSEVEFGRWTDRPTLLGNEIEIVVSWLKGPSKFSTVDVKPWALDIRLL